MINYSYLLAKYLRILHSKQKKKKLRKKLNLKINRVSKKKKKLRKKLNLKINRAPKIHIFFRKKIILLNETSREETKNKLEEGEKITCFQEIKALQKDREKLSSELTNKMETLHWCRKISG